MSRRRIVAYVGLLAIFASSCGSSSSPTTPVVTTPAPVLAANVVLTGQGAWTGCIGTSCVFSASVQNNGAGCATGITVVTRLFDSNSAQVGSDIQMGTVQSPGLSARTLRPNEILAIASQIYIDGATINRAATYRLFPTWNNTACS